MCDLGVVISDEDAECMISEADLDGDGKINYQGMSHTQKLFWYHFLYFYQKINIVFDILFP